MLCRSSHALRSLGPYASLSMGVDGRDIADFSCIMSILDCLKLLEKFCHSAREGSFDVMSPSFIGDSGS